MTVLIPGSTDSYESKQSRIEKTTTSVANLLFYARVAYLFTASDLMPTVVPNIVFGVLSPFAGSVLITSPLPSPLIFLQRMMVVSSYVWMCVLTFCIANQCCSDSTNEDLRNKPWRPVPAGLISPARGRQLLLVCEPAVLLIGWALNVHWETAICLVLSYQYNTRKWGDRSPMVRNTLVAVFLSATHYASLKIVSGPHADATQKAHLWIVMLGAIIATTIHVSDFHDMEGDKEESRQTIPLTIGETPARWSVAVGVLFWSAAAYWFWALKLVDWPLPYLLGLTVAVRQVLMRGKKEDRKTWMYWAFWTVSLYTLPLRARV